ncbi:G-protein coupled receptor [Branchiostoma belcheri]|nr:G-protein coupled receptor [Branchiostoma belcheri]
MNGSTANLTGGNSTAFETFWPCFLWHLENRTEYDLAVSACSHLPKSILDENKKVGIASAAVGTVALLMNVVFPVGTVFTVDNDGRVLYLLFGDASGAEAFV